MKTQGISTPLKNKLEKCNFYALRTVLNLDRSTEYKDCLRLASMDTLIQRRLTASLIMLSSFSYIISHSWNQLPSSLKSATTLAEFKTGLSRITTLGCKCNKCISIQLQEQGYELIIRLQGQGYKLGDQGWQGFRGGSGLGLGVGAG